MKVRSILFFLLSLLMASCSKETTTGNGPELELSFRFDKEQPRLNNIGQPSAIPPGHAAQTPNFSKLSVHYVELAPMALTQLGQGAIVYKGAETTAGGDNAVDFDKAAVVGEKEVFANISLKNVPPGTYEWVRASVTFQQYDVKFNLRNIPAIGDLYGQEGTVASFVGFNTYISKVTPKSRSLTVNANKKQGFWAFETAFSAPYDPYNALFSGDAPAGATTVVNPLFQSSPIPPGSCVVTGKFPEPLVVTGNEPANIKVVLSFSINNSFEWEDFNGNGELDLFADDPAKNDKVVDMGLRGLIPEWK
ncbi:MAG: hypothetical protein R2830_05835 [Saprospiraceae bacterium]